MKKKICRICKEEKPATLDYFYKSPGCKYQVSGSCKKCYCKKTKKEKPNIPDGYKYCRKCDSNKKISDFNKDKSKSDGLQLYCRECRKIERKQQETRRLKKVNFKDPYNGKNKLNRNENDWLDVICNDLQIIKKLREEDYPSFLKLKDGKKRVFYKQDILLVKCKCGAEQEMTARSIIRNKPISCPSCSNSKSKIGDECGTLVCKKIFHDENDIRRIVCECKVCGTEKTVNPSSFTYGCISCETCFPRENFISKGANKPIQPKRYLQQLKTQAFSRNLDVNIDLDFILKLLEKQKYKCALSGIEIRFEIGNLSLDRIDSSKGYSKDNVQFVYRQINFMKNKMKDSDFIEICKSVASYNS